MKVIITSNTLSFKCLQCGDCCRSWDVFFSKETIDKIQNNISLFPKLQKNPDFYNVINPDNPVFYANVKLHNQRCIFLSEDHKCDIFNAFGKDNGNMLCLSFPSLKLKLKDRFTIVSSLACSQQVGQLFNDDLLSLRNIDDEINCFNWPVIICDQLDHIKFSSDISMCWEGYYFFEEFFINKTHDDKLSLTQIFVAIADFHRAVLSSKLKILSLKDIQSILEKIKFSSEKKAYTLDKILFFIKRKKNLYQYTPFADLVKDMLDSGAKLFESEEKDAFEKEYKKWERGLKNSFIIKFFSILSNFLISLQFSHHVLMFYFGFIKLFVFTAWIKNRKIDKKDIILAIHYVEKYFLHDTNIFRFWGQGKRGANDFNETSLLEMII